ncbi:MAG: hypothetical protein JNL42_19615 [Anaerolineae bacterium]|nr:hypothetical protein [Anaerolineae bacterium]
MMSMYMMKLLVKAHVEPRYEAAEMDRLAEIARGDRAESPDEVITISERELDTWERRHETPRIHAPRLTLRRAHR